MFPGSMQFPPKPYNSEPTYQLLFLLETPCAVCYPCQTNARHISIRRIRRGAMSRTKERREGETGACSWRRDGLSVYPFRAPDRDDRGCELHERTRLAQPTWMEGEGALCQKVRLVRVPRGAPDARSRCYHAAACRSSIPSPKGAPARGALGVTGLCPLLWGVVSMPREQRLHRASKTSCRPASWYHHTGVTISSAARRQLSRRASQSKPGRRQPHNGHWPGRTM